MEKKQNLISQEKIPKGVKSNALTRARFGKKKAYPSYIRHPRTNLNK